MLPLASEISKIMTVDFKLVKCRFQAPLLDKNVAFVWINL